MAPARRRRRLRRPPAERCQNPAFTSKSAIRSDSHDRGHRFRGRRDHALTVPRRATAVPRTLLIWAKGPTDGFERGVRSQVRGRAARSGGSPDGDLRVAIYDGTTASGRGRGGQKTDF